MDVRQKRFESGGANVPLAQQISDIPKVNLIGSGYFKPGLTARHSPVVVNVSCMSSYVHSFVPSLCKRRVRRRVETQGRSGRIYKGAADSWPARDFHGLDRCCRPRIAGTIILKRDIIDFAGQSARYAGFLVHWLV